MIAHLSGKILMHRNGVVILDVSGVGYKIKLPKTEGLKDGDEASYFIHHHIREEVSDLFGFVSYDELELFEYLISVNGVGPKAGMLIMASANPKKIISAILNEDMSFFQAISGIGKKVAQKIILDLKGKITGIDSENIIGNLDGGGEVVSALESLGYKGTEIAKIIPKIPTECKAVEDQIKWVLKNIR